MTQPIDARQQPYFDRMVGYLMDNPPATPSQAAARTGGMLEDRGEDGYAEYLDSDCKAVRAILALMSRLAEAGAVPGPTDMAKPLFTDPAARAANGVQAN